MKDTNTNISAFQMMRQNLRNDSSNKKLEFVVSCEMCCEKMIIRITPRRSLVKVDKSVSILHVKSG